MPLPLEIFVDEIHNRKALRLKGRLDANTVPLLQKTCDEQKVHKLLIDFSGVTYLSSAGIRLLVATAKKLKAAGGGLVLCGMQGQVQEVIKMAGFDKILSIYKSEGDALTAL